MHFFGQLLAVLALCMDGFAAMLSMGLSIEDKKRRILAAAAITFFHSLFFAMGYGFGGCFSFVPWLGGGILIGMGLAMLRPEGGNSPKKSIDSAGKIFLLSLATGADAMAAGFSFALMGEKLGALPAMVAAVMAALCVLALTLDQMLGQKFCRRAEHLGAWILIALGIKSFLSLL